MPTHQQICTLLTSGTVSREIRLITLLPYIAINMLAMSEHHQSFKEETPSSTTSSFLHKPALCKHNDIIHPHHNIISTPISTRRADMDRQTKHTPRRDRAKIKKRNDDIMSLIGKGNHLVKDAIRGKRGERTRKPEMVEDVHKHEKGAPSENNKNVPETPHTSRSMSVSNRSHGLDVGRSAAADRPPTRRKKTRHVDELIFENGNTFHCSLCLKVYQSLRAAREHIKLKHNERYRQ